MTIINTRVVALVRVNTWYSLPQKISAPGWGRWIYTLLLRHLPNRVQLLQPNKAEKQGDGDNNFVVT